jgi:hypothetical protein
MKSLALVIMFVGLAAAGFAQEAEPLAAVTPISPTELEGWFFNFLERLLGLFADFIGKILGDIFGGIGGLFAGGEASAHV